MSIETVNQQIRPNNGKWHAGKIEKSLAISDVNIGAYRFRNFKIKIRIA